MARSRSKTKGNSRATIKDVARLAGVSIATVSRAINEPALVAPDTASQVNAAIAKLNYRPNAGAQGLVKQKTNTLGLLFPEFGDDFIFPLLRGIEAVTRQNDYNLLVFSTQVAETDIIKKPRSLGEHNTDGLIVFVDSLPDRELFRLNQIGFPVVLIHRATPKGLNIPCITIENKNSVKLMIDHLIRVHNCRRIAFLTGEESHEDSYWREMGYRESLAENGILYDPELVANGGFIRDIAQAATHKMLMDGVEFDAIFTGDDEAAIGVFEALKNAGKRVPDDVAVVGFDDTPPSRYLDPPLTTIRAPIEQVGRDAVRQLVRLIRGEEVEPLLLLPTEPVIRRSCGCHIKV